MNNLSSSASKPLSSSSSSSSARNKNNNNRRARNVLLSTSNSSSNLKSPKNPSAPTQKTRQRSSSAYSSSVHHHHHHFNLINSSSNEITQFPSYESLLNQSNNLNQSTSSSSSSSTTTNNNKIKNNNNNNNNKHPLPSPSSISSPSSKTFNKISSIININHHSSSSPSPSSALPNLDQQQTRTFFYRNILKSLSSIIPIINRNQQSDKTVNGTDHQSYSSLSLFYLSVPLLGWQLGMTITHHLGVRFLISLRPSALVRSIVWVSLPISSILIPIYVGIRSDSDHSNSFRRRSWILRFTILMVSGLVMLSLSNQLGCFLSWLIGIDEGDWDPKHQMNSILFTILISALAIIIINLSIYGLKISIQGLMIDSVSADYQLKINGLSVFLENFSNIFIFGIISASMKHRFVDDPNRGAATNPIDYELKLLSFICVPIIVGTSLIGYFKCTERKPFVGEPSNLQDSNSTDINNDQSSSSSSSLPTTHVQSPSSTAITVKKRRPKRSTISKLKSNFSQFTKSLLELPVPIKRVCGLQFLNSIIWLTVLYYSKPLIVRLTILETIYSSSKNSRTGKIDQELINYGNYIGFRSMINLYLTASVSMILIYKLSNIGRSRLIYNRKSSKWKFIKKNLIYRITPRNLWSLSFGIYGILVLSFLGRFNYDFFWFVKRDQGYIGDGGEDLFRDDGAKVLVGLLGIIWAISQWVPISLLMEYTRSIEETRMINLPILKPPITIKTNGVSADEDGSNSNGEFSKTKKNNSGLSTLNNSNRLIDLDGFDSGLGKRRASAVDKNRIENGCSGVREGVLGGDVEGEEFELVNRLVSCRKYPTLKGGQILAIFHLSTALPHLIVTILSSLKYELVELYNNSGDVEGKSMEEVLRSETILLIYNFKLTGLIGLGVFLMVVIFRKIRIVVPTSELEYWDELNYQVHYEEEI